MKTKVIVFTLLFVAFGLFLGASAQVQTPPKKQPGNAQRALKQNAQLNTRQNTTQDTGREVRQI